MSARAVLVCHPDPFASSSAEWTFWADAEEAVRAEAELAHPCGPRCQQIHTIVRLDVPLEPRRRPSSPRTRTASTAAVAADGADT